MAKICAWRATGLQAGAAVGCGWGVGPVRASGESSTQSPYTCYSDMARPALQSWVNSTTNVHPTNIVGASFVWSVTAPAPLRTRSSICCADTTTIDDHRDSMWLRTFVACAHASMFVVELMCVVDAASPSPHGASNKQRNQRVYKHCFVLIQRVNTQTQHYHVTVSDLLSNETWLRHHCIYITHAHGNL